MTKKKEKAIKKHFNKAMKEFKKEALEIAITHDYPYIEALLETTIILMRENIRWHRADIRGYERELKNLA